MDSRNVDERINILREKKNCINLQLNIFEIYLWRLKEYPYSLNIIELNFRLQRLMDVYSTFNDVYTELRALEPEPLDKNSRSINEKGGKMETMENRYIEAVVTGKKLVAKAETAEYRRRTEMAGSANNNETATLRECVSLVVRVLQTFEKKLNETS